MKPIIRLLRNSREILRTKDKDSRDKWVTQSYKGMMIFDDDSGMPVMQGNGYTHKWFLNDSSSDLQTDNNNAQMQRRVEVCRDAYIGSMGITKFEIDRAANSFRTSSSRESVRSRRVKPYKDEDVMPYDFNRSREIFLTQVIDSRTRTTHIEEVDDDMVRCAMIPKGEKYTFALSWLKKHFAVFGDHAPDKDLTQLATTWRHDIYVAYENHLREFQSNNPLAAEGMQFPLIEKCNSNEFNDIWLSLFPNHVTRQYVNVVGKCSTCYEISKCRQESSDRVVWESCQQLHHLHRGGLFMLERMNYQENRAKALLEPHRVMSLIIDGMDTQHSKVPHKGTQDSFGDALSQSLLGVLVHGRGVRLYRHFDNVTKGANLTIYAIEKEIERWRDEHNGMFPEEIYIQLDGGSENANHHVLAYLEYMVSKRYCLKLFYTRLPTGHTHDDIDAAFGRLWVWLRSKQVESPSAFKTMVEEAFKNSKLRFTVHDVYVVPDIVSWIDPHIDTVHCYAKELHTQHCWRMFAVKRSTYFPHGAAVQYKAYASDMVVEIVKKEKVDCVSELGQLTGLEPWTLYNEWYPNGSTHAQRIGIEGDYFLLSDPDDTTSPILPFPFKVGYDEDFKKCMNEVRKTWKSLEPTRKQWEEWWSTECPRNETAQDYVTRKGCFDIPLPSFKAKNVTNTASLWTHSLQSTMPVQPPPREAFPWPELKAAAMPSVKSKWTGDYVPPARVWASKADNDALKERLEDITKLSKPIYESSLDSKSNDYLKFTLRRRVTDGISHSVSGTKASLVKSIKASDRLALFISSSSPSNLLLVK